MMGLCLRPLRLRWQKTFRSVWMVPRRTAAKAALERHRGRDLRADADLDLLMDALYGPIYFRLLAGHRALSEKFTDALAEVVLQGIAQR